MHFYVHFGELESWIVDIVPAGKKIDSYDMLCETTACFLAELTNRQPEIVAAMIHNGVDVTPDSLKESIRAVLRRPEVYVEATSEIERITDALDELVSNTDEWLNSSNDAFDGESPLSVIEGGGGSRVWQMIYTLRSGGVS